MDSNIQDRVKYFNAVRDIPYYISLDREKDRSCATKAQMLARLLSQLGLKTRYIICEFSWEDMNLPHDVVKQPHDQGSDYHQFLEVHIPEKTKWVVVDPTWDTGLATICPINYWDGLNNTEIAVPAKKVYSPKESEEWIKMFNQTYNLENYVRRNGKYLDAINHYFNKSRK